MEWRYWRIIEEYFDSYTEQLIGDTWYSNCHIAEIWKNKSKPLAAGKAEG